MIKFLCPAFGDIDQRDNVSRDVYYTAVGSYNVHEPKRSIKWKSRLFSVSTVFIVILDTFYLDWVTFECSAKLKVKYKCRLREFEHPRIVQNKYF